MAADSKPVPELTPLQKAAIAVREMRGRLDAVEQQQHEPIAIVGMGCRFPGGVDSPETYWSLLSEGTDAISEVPSDRWDLNEFYDASPDTLGRMYTRWGGFVDGIDRFDPEFFGISPREAVTLDPQQRLLLEVAWETLEDAGESPTSLIGSSTGVFIGITTHDYVQRTLFDVPPDRIDAHCGTGGSTYVAVGRLSHVFGFEGPNIPVDTACSSSLVAIHLAVQSLRRRECDLALAGGVNVILSPELTVYFCRLRALAPDGRCKTFDARADGFTRGEGCGIVGLKRLSDAVRDGNRILAVIRGTAVNHDGRSGGLTVPNGLAQQAVIRNAMADGRVEPDAVQYVEAHGTGTKLGDPVEVNALKTALNGPNRATRPLLIGSVKTNFGHLEAAAGVAGVMKAVLSLQHGRVPPNRHFETLNPHITSDGASIEIPVEPTDWPQTDKPRLAGVSSFGMSGTNAHAVLEQAPVETTADAKQNGSSLLVLSARDRSGLRNLARQYQTRLRSESCSPIDMALTAATGRAHFAHRVAVCGTDAGEMARALGEFADSESETPHSPTPGKTGLLAGSGTRQTTPRIAFLFTGQGSQYVGMGRSLYESAPTFREKLDECDDRLKPHLDQSITELILSGPDDLLNQTGFTQPALFAVEYALAMQWKAWGIQPYAVMGHSVGEFAAATLAGIISLDDAARLIATRARWMQDLPSGGTMAAVFAGVERVEPAIRSRSDELAIAAINGPANTVISGRATAVTSAIRELAEAGIDAHPLTVSHAFHSPLIEPALSELNGLAADLSFRDPQVRFISNLTGRAVSAGEINGEYWSRHARQPVRFADGLRAIDKLGCEILIEIGPQPVLCGMAAQCLAGDSIRRLPSLQRGRDDVECLQHALATLYVDGVDVDWGEVFSESPGRRVSLPTYPFQRERYWYTSPDTSSSTHQSSRFQPETESSDQLARQLQRSVPDIDSETIHRVLHAISDHQRRADDDSTIRDWFYRLNWEEQPLDATAVESSVGSECWLILSDRGGVGTAIADDLTGRGDEVFLVTLDDGVCRARLMTTDGIRELPEPGIDGADELQRLVQFCGDYHEAGLTGVLHLWSLNADVPESDEINCLADAEQFCCRSVVRTIQGLVESTNSARTRLWVVTSNAVSSIDRHELVNPSQALAWGIGRTAALEHPELRVGLIDIAAADGGRCADDIIREIRNGNGDDQILLRGEKRYVARIDRHQPSHASSEFRIRPDASYLITGGTGVLGLHTAKWLAARGARWLILTGRRGLVDEQAHAIVAELRADDVQVTVVKADVAYENDVERLFAEVDSLSVPLAGIFHAAGVVSFAKLRELEPDELANVLRPKTLGGWLLHSRTRERDIDLFVTFSSVSAVWGSGGQSHYAAANQFLDSLVAMRRAENLPGLSVNWGPWADGGMTTSELTDAVQNLGLKTLPPAMAMRALELALSATESDCIVADVHWDRFCAVLESGRRRSFLARVRPESTQPAATDGSPLRDELRSLRRSSRRARLTRRLQEEVAGVLSIPLDRLPDPARGFFDLGMDSMMSVELRRRIESAAGCELPTTLTFDYPDIDRLCDFLLRDVFEFESANSDADAPVVRSSSGTNRPHQLTVEPIAVVGIGCRLPGGIRDPDALWQAFVDGRDLVTEIPSERWDADAFHSDDPDVPGRSYARHGAFLDDVKSFDAGFFGIAPREALSMDPQQRLLLEIGWETLERAGVDFGALRGSRTGVYVGVSASEYSRLVTADGDFSGIDTYYGTGNALNALAGRIAFQLGLQGPAVVVDTACSSSLVAVHLACQSLRSLESDLVLAGGTNLILSPESMIGASRARMLSPTGRCHTFDASADGYVRGEGVALVALKRLEDARQDGDRILAVICGSAVNQDGSSSGLTVPNGPSQERVIRDALRSAGLSPANVDYIEAHGTGTELGDPIELRALGNVFQQDESSRRKLLVGSAKTNFGHLESAAGITGLLKVVLSLAHGEVPPHLHFEQPSPKIAWSEIPVEVPVKRTPWPGRSDTPTAGVSSFGFTGTNAHVVLQQAPESDRAARDGFVGQGLLPVAEEQTGSSSASDKRVATVARRWTNTASVHALASGATAKSTSAGDRTAHVLTLSARSPAALQALAREFANRTRYSSDSPADVCFTAATGRAHHAHRLAVVAKQMEEIAEQLQVFADEPHASAGAAARYEPSNDEQRIAFLFSGRSALDAHEAAPLYETSPRFRDVIDRCSEAAGSINGTQLSDVLGDPELLRQPQYARPALFAVQAALTEIWREWGVIPTSVVGHDIGEFGAAYAAGVLSLEDGIRLISTWGADEFATTCREVDFREPEVELISAVTGQPLTTEATHADYWIALSGQAGLFAEGLRTFDASGITACVEMGPDSIIASAERRLESSAVWLPSLQRGADPWRRLLESLAELYMQGATIDWTAFDTHWPRQKVSLPTYPFQREEFWLPQRPVVRSAGCASASVFPGRRLRLPNSTEVRYENLISRHNPACLDDHRLFDSVVVPAASHISLTLAAMVDAFAADKGCELEDLLFPEALVLADGDARTLQASFSPDADTGGAVQVMSLRDETDAHEPESWVTHFTGRYSTSVIDPVGTHGSDQRFATGPDGVAAVRQLCPRSKDGTAFYESFREDGYTLGPAFRWIDDIRSGEGQAVCRMRVPELPDRADDYEIHPGLLDSCFQLVGTAFQDSMSDLDRGSFIYIPFRLGRVRFYGRPPSGESLWCHAVLQRGASGTDAMIGDVRLLDANGAPILDIVGFEGRKASREVLLRSLQPEQPNLLYDVRWDPQAPSVAHAPVAGPAQWILIGDATEIVEPLKMRLQADGHECTVAALPAEFEQVLDSSRCSELPLAGIVDLRVGQAVGAVEEADRVNDECRYTLSLVQTLLARSDPNRPRVWFVTRGAQPVGESSAQVDTALASVLGMARVIAQEHPEFQFTCVDLDPDTPDQPGVESATLLYSEIVSNDTEKEVAIRDGERLVARLNHAGTTRSAVSGSAGRQLTAPPDSPYRLQLAKFGQLDEFSLSPQTRRTPAADEVEVEVATTGLNFRDVLRALGLLQEHERSLGIESAQDAPFGFEFAGTVIGVGSGVDGFTVGDQVLGLASGSMASHVTVNARCVVSRPEQLSPQDAATISFPFMTALFGLNDLGALQPGERVLIHAAAGGVGMAAVQIALDCQAEVFCTASPAKWDLLHSMGVRHVMNSRTLDFADTVMQLTDGAGVDVVLNSLTGDFIPRSIEILAEGGRFVELGKIGIWDTEQVRQLRSDVTYLPFDMVQEFRNDLQLMPSLLSRVVSLHDENRIRPLRVTKFSIGQVETAFRTMQRGRHIGKVVITQRSSRESTGESPEKADGTWLITGGLGSLGLKIAAKLVDLGARHLALVSRRDITSSEQQDVIDVLQADGTQVAIVTADVADHQALATAVADVRDRMPELRGVVHAAGVLGDGMLRQMAWSDFEHVLRPKVAGAWNLHQVTKDCPLDHFVMFSSAAALIGSQGQANYAAGNAFLDALAHERRRCGLPALSINWGPWSDGGMASGLDDRTQVRWSSMGLRAIAGEQGVRIFGELLKHEAAQVAVLDVDWRRFVAAQTVVSRLFDNLRPARQQNRERGGFRSQLTQAATTVRRDLLVDHIQQCVAQVLGLRNADSVSPSEGFQELGMDSLTSVELRNRLQNTLDVSLTSTVAFDYPNVDSLTAYLTGSVLAELFAQEETPESAERTDATSGREAELDEMSEDEMLDVLAQKLTDLD